MAKKKESPQVTEWNYSPSPESTTHVKLEKRYALFINNEWVAPSSKAYFRRNKTKERRAGGKGKEEIIRKEI